jgi:hypothetical protein
LEKKGIALRASKAIKVSIIMFVGWMTFGFLSKRGTVNVFRLKEAVLI